MRIFVIFDMDGTLYDLYAPFAEAVRQCLKEETPPDDVLKQIFAASRRYSDELRAQGVNDAEQLVRQRSRLAFSEFGQPLSEAQSIELQRAYASAQAHLRMEPAMRNLLACLREAGAQLALLSNGDARHQREKARQLGADAYIPVQRQFFSGMIHRDKPDPALFRWVEEQLQVAQGDVIWYVGDSYEADVIGAHDAGWRSIWSQAYLPQKQLSVNGTIDRVAVDLDELREQLIAVLKGAEWDEMCRKR